MFLAVRENKVLNTSYPIPNTWKNNAMALAKQTACTKNRLRKLK